ncbi:nucleotide exchange factor GrpE [Plantactinospora siamensis]|uniref:Protein GrpE n=1 Tax=Plantactinospora siamensis TaxID=555372 RepID=A0ABV6NR60_9ACTN
MTDKPRHAKAGDAGPAQGGSVPGTSARDDAADAGPANPAGERVVIRDKRRVDPSGGKGEPTDPPADGDQADGTGDAEVKPETSTEAELADESAERAAEAEAEAAATTGGDTPVVDAPAEPLDSAANRSGALGAELEALRAELDERTRDVQRVSAEYANYRKRVDRDRGLQAEQTTGTVLTALLPILDDLDRAREHGDLVGPFGTVAEQLTAALGKFGLAAFGEKGDQFDPTRHEAVAHQTSAEVTEPTCVEVMRRGYQLGERLLRPALVAVADPE